LIYFKDIKVVIKKEMIVKNLPGYYYITHINEHTSVKEKLLSAMDDLPLDDKELGEEDIEKTDWNLHEEYYREYLEIFYDMITPYMQNMGRNLLATRWQILNTWFQRYKKNNSHAWHVHGMCMYANVYFLELPSDELVTELYDVHSNSIIKLEGIKEGDLITFPSYFIHRSPKNTTDSKKTIISFNSNFYDTDQNRVSEKLSC